MNAYMCSVCGFLYDDQSASKNVEGNSISFEELPGDWVCPNCGLKPGLFIPVESDRTPDLSD